MNWSIQYTEVIWCWGIVATTWMVFAFFQFKGGASFKEIRRSVYFMMGVVGIALLITRPQFSTLAREVKVSLLTTGSENYKRNSGDIFFNDVYSFLNSTVATQVKEVHIHGFGLPQSELEFLSDYKIIYHPATLVTGINQYSLPVISEGEEWMLTGTFAGDNVLSIQLLSLNGQRHIAEIEDSTFQISSRAPVAGEYLYDLEVLLDSGDTIREVLPVSVQHEPNWNMLVLSSYPSFEINYLKNYWTSLGNGFALRLMIAREKYQSSFVNLSRLDLNQLSKNTIDNFDFILTDIHSWNQLSIRERSVILQAVKDEGTGLIIRPDNQFIKAININHPTWSATKELKVPGKNEEVTLLQFPISSSSWKSVVQGPLNLGSFQSFGLGSILLLGVDETYKCILSDEVSLYRSIWSTIFTKLYRDFSQVSTLIRPEWIWEKEKVNMQLLTSENIQNTIQLNDSLQLPYLKLPFIEGYYEVSLWPKSGSNYLSIPEREERLDFYVHGKDAWKAVRQMKLSNSTRNAVHSSHLLKQESIFENQEIPFYWWYSLVLIGFGLLWWDETMYA